MYLTSFLILTKGFLDIDLNNINQPRKLFNKQIRSSSFYMSLM